MAQEDAEMPELIGTYVLMAVVRAAPRMDCWRVASDCVSKSTIEKMVAEKPVGFVVP